MDNSELQYQLEEALKKIADLEKKVDAQGSDLTQWNNFQLRAPLDTYTKRLIEDAIDDSSASGSYMTVSSVDTITGAKTFSDSTLILAGSSSGTTTLKASAAASGTVTLPATTGTVVLRDDAVTLENKRITKRFGSTTDTSSLTINSDSYDIYAVTALAQAMTINAPSGTPTHGQPLLIRIKDNATARALTWNSIFRVIGVSLPATTVISKYNYVGAVYNSTDTKWDVVMSLQEV